MTGLDETWTNYLIEYVAKRFGDAGKVKKDSILDDTTTHLIVGKQRRTEKLLSGMDDCNCKYFYRCLNKGIIEQNGTHERTPVFSVAFHALPS